MPHSTARRGCVRLMRAFLVAKGSPPPISILQIFHDEAVFRAEPLVQSLLRDPGVQCDGIHAYGVNSLFVEQLRRRLQNATCFRSQVGYGFVCHGQKYTDLYSRLHE